MLVLDRIIEQHSDDEILKNVSKIIQYFTTNFAVAQYTETARLRLIDGIALQLRYGMQRFIEEEEKLDDEDEAALLSSYRKMAAFLAYFFINLKIILIKFSCIDIRNWDIWDLTLNLLKNSKDRFQSPDLGEKAVLVLFESLVWDIKHLIKDNETNEVSFFYRKLKKYYFCFQEVFQKIRKRRDQFLQCTNAILRDNAFGVENVHFILNLIYKKISCFRHIFVYVIV